MSNEQPTSFFKEEKAKGSVYSRVVDEVMTSERDAGRVS